MPDLKLNARAETDLDDIADYSYLNFGLARGDAYRDALMAALHSLTQLPDRGMSCDHIKKQSRRLFHESHVIYYRVTPSMVVIQRILHQSQDPLRHL